MKFSKNGNQYYSGTFVLKQNIKPKKVPDYKQFDSTSATDDYDEDCYFDDPHYSHRCTGSPNENYFTIQRKGCYLSSIANVLSYFGISTNPGTLNTGLNALPNGFAGAGNVNPDGVQQYAANNNVQVTNNFQAPSDLSTLVCQDGPQLLGVNCNANGYPTH